MKIIRVLVLLIALLTGGVAIALALSTPSPLPPGSESEARLAMGPYAVNQVEETWVDSPTALAGHPRCQGIL